MAERLERGDVVADPNEPSRAAVVIDGPVDIGGTRYWEVLHGDQQSGLFPERSLVKQDVRSKSPVAWLTERALADPDSFARYLTHLRISSGLTDLYYSFSSTRTLFRVHQFKPVLKAIGSTSPRLLLADEVGLGKTIEAGLVWAELDARAPTRRVLVLCPTSLRTKWCLEMERRFDREMAEVNRDGFLRFIDQYYERGDATRFWGVSGFAQLRHDEVLTALSERPPTFDLVIVDEAHAMRNPATKTHQLGDLLAQNSTALLLLSATPVNLGSQDLFNLLTLLHPDQFDSPEVFNHLLAPNQAVNEAARLLRSSFPPPTVKVAEALRRVEQTALATRFEEDPIYRDILDRLDGGVVSRREVAELQAEIQNLNTLSHVYTRTRKRDLRDHTTVRRAERLEVELTEAEADVYRAATHYVAQLKRRYHGVAPGLAAIMPARQASSCLPVMAEYIERVLAEHRIRFDLAEGGEDDEDGPSEVDLQLSLDEENALAAVAAACDRARGVDTKFQVFGDRMEGLRAQGTGKFLVFSFFRLTLAYLEQRLTQAGFRCRQMTGATPMRDRPAVLDEFRNGDLEVLLCSEIGSEGLDFEFCDVVVNYDLPWNPMKLEQRIGRIDRFGQQSAAVRILNFVVPGTIDTEIFFRLYDRIGVFERSIGELEPILGEQFHHLQTAIAASQLTTDEQQRIVDQVALAVEREQRETDEFESVRDQLIGADAFVEDALEEARDSHRYVTAAELRRYVVGFLREQSTAARLTASAEIAGLDVLQGDPEELAEQMRTYGREFANPRFLDLVARLETGSSVPVTFDADVAYRHQCEFLTIRHPLVQAMKQHQAEHDPFHRAGYARIEESERIGRWVFFLVLLTAGGLQPRRSLYAVAHDPATGDVDEQVGNEIVTYLTGSGPTRIAERDLPVVEPRIVQGAYEAVLTTVDEARRRLEEDLGRRNAALVSARQESLRQGLHVQRSRLSMMADRLNLDERIKRMRLAQIRNLEVRTQMEIDQLEAQRSVTVGFRIVAGGVADFAQLGFIPAE